MYFLLTVTAKLRIAASKFTISNEDLLFPTTVTINRRTFLKFTVSLMIKFVFRMASTFYCDNDTIFLCYYFPTLSETAADSSAGSNVYYCDGMCTFFF